MFCAPTQTIQDTEVVMVHVVIQTILTKARFQCLLPRLRKGAAQQTINPQRLVRHDLSVLGVQQLLLKAIVCLDSSRQKNELDSPQVIFPQKNDSNALTRLQ